jgi:hypothetical protein
MHHKETKYHSKLTQKVEEKFEKQTAQREDEFALLDLAVVELEEHATQWDYLDLGVHRGPHTRRAKLTNEGQPVPIEGQIAPVPMETTTGGAVISVFEGEDGKPAWRISPDNKDVTWDTQALDFLYSLQVAIQEEGHHLAGGLLTICTEHKRDGICFRGHPDFRGDGQWNDWALVDWGRGYGKTPAEIWCYVDLTEQPDAFRMVFRDSRLQKGVYALVETSHYVEMPVVCGLEVPLVSETFKAFDKDVAHNEDGSVRRTFWLADVNAFVEPIAVVPNIGHPNKVQYFEMVPRKKWSDLFIKWLKEPHTAELKELDEVEGKKVYKNPPPSPKKRKRKAKANKKKAAEA